MNAMLDETWTAAPETQAMPPRLRGVTRRYGKVVALDNVDFEVRQGELLALLGPNGAGKTTANSLLLGLVQPGAGRAELFGCPPWTGMAPDPGSLIHQRRGIVPCSR